MVSTKGFSFIKLYIACSQAATAMLILDETMIVPITFCVCLSYDFVPGQSILALHLLHFHQTGCIGCGGSLPSQVHWNKFKIFHSLRYYIHVSRTPYVSLHYWKYRKNNGNEQHCQMLVGSHWSSGLCIFKWPFWPVFLNILYTTLETTDLLIIITLSISNHIKL